MKNKKLFAILTLVCFMFTLMPVAAFATTPVEKYVALSTAGEATDDYQAVDANTLVTASVTDENFAPIDATEYLYFVETKTGAPVMVTTTAGQIQLKAEGTYYVYAIEATANIKAIYNDAANDFSDMIEAFGNARYQNLIVDNYATLKVTAGTDVYDIELSGAGITETEEGKWALSMTADNGFTPVKITAKVLANGQNAKEAAVKYSSNGIKVVNADTETDNRGRAEFTLTATNAGTYTVKVTCGDATDVITVTVDRDGANQIVTTAEPTAPVDIKTAIADTGIAFKVTDVNGNNITTDAANPATIYGVEDMVPGTDYAVVVEKQPADSDFDGSEFTLAFDATYKYVELTGPALAEEGDYTFTVKMKNGNSATASVKVKEFDEDAIKGLVVAFPSNNIALGQSATVAKLFLVDANGVQRNIYTGTYADMGNVSLSANGKAVASFAGTTVMAKDDEDYIGSTIDVFAVYGEYTANATLTVVEAATSLQFVKTVAEVGVNSTLVANIVDSEGNTVALGSNTTLGTPQVIVLDKPENAVANGSAAFNSQNNGLNITFVASAAGEYKVQVIVPYTEDHDNDALTPEIARYISGITTVTVGAQEDAFKDVVVVSMGADSMIVNNKLVKLDVAPFIENNRTMMQFNVLYVFGIDVEWVAETQSIVAEGDGIKVVMTLGSKVAVVNGAEVALDVAPYSVNGRTVVPVGFITGTFGINPAFTYNADGTIADIIFTAAK